jgi:hypothetical protein
LHFDAARLRRFAALHADMQHAIAVVGARRIRVDVVGQADDTSEAALETFVQVQRGLLVAVRQRGLADNSNCESTSVMLLRGLKEAAESAGVEPSREPTTEPAYAEPIAIKNTIATINSFFIFTLL